MIVFVDLFPESELVMIKINVAKPMIVSKVQGFLTETRATVFIPLSREFTEINTRHFFLVIAPNQQIQSYQII